MVSAATGCRDSQLFPAIDGERRQLYDAISVTFCYHRRTPWPSSLYRK